LTAAVTILGTAAGIDEFSLEVVAKKAGVTRLTVYNQFGSRRAVLEAVFDEMAARGGLHRLAEAVSGADPHAALLQIIGIFCEFWNFDPGALGLLHVASASNPEFAVGVSERNERRRRLFSGLVRRIAEDRPIRPKAQRDLVDILYALTSFSFFSELIAGGRVAAAACSMIQDLATDAVRRATSLPSG
jgi:AcrR family transcriptional regulator